MLIEKADYKHILSLLKDFKLKDYAHMLPIKYLVRQDVHR